MENVDALIKQLRAANADQRAAIRGNLLELAKGANGGEVRSHLERAAKGEVLEVQWELEEVIDAVTPKKVVPAEPEAPEEPAPRPKPNKRLGPKDLVLVYDDPRGLDDPPHQASPRRDEDAPANALVRHAGRAAHEPAPDLGAPSAGGRAAEDPAAREPVLGPRGGRGLRMRWGLAVFLIACGGSGKLVRKGDGYLDKGHYPAAIRTYKDVLDKNPDNVKALVGTARAWIAAGHPDRAISTARRASALGSLDARILLVEALVATGRGAEAVEEAERALASLEGENPKLVRLLAEARVSTGDLEGAKKDLATALERMQDPELMSLAAYLAFRTGDVPRAKELIERAADSGIGQEEIPSVEADAAALFMLFGDDDRYRESVNILKSLVPDAERLYLDKAVTLAEAGSVESSLRLLHWAFAVDPEDGRVARHIGILYHQRQSWELALGFLQRAAKLQPYASRDSDLGVRYETKATGSLSAEQIQIGDRRALRRDGRLLPGAQSPARRGGHVGKGDDNVDDVGARRLAARRARLGTRGRHRPRGEGSARGTRRRRAQRRGAVPPRAHVRARGRRGQRDRTRATRVADHAQQRGGGAPPRAPLREATRLRRGARRLHDAARSHAHGPPFA